MPYIRDMSDIIFNEKDSRYERPVEGHMVYAQSHMKDDVLYVDYVYAAPELRGKGAAGAFMNDLMVMARAKGWKVKPICGYAAGWLRRHSEFDDLRAAD